jgi:hypothetical protein
MDDNPEQEPFSELPPDLQGAPEERAPAPIAEPPAGALPPAQSPPSLGEVPDLLARTAPWTQLLAIMGFGGVVLMIVIGIGAGLVGLATGRAETAVLMVIYPLSALLYFFPSLYMLQYAKRSRQFANRGPFLSDLESALDAQRKFWKFSAIAAVIGLGLGMLAFVGAILFSLLARAVDV